jgi:hypothetical protein
VLGPTAQLEAGFAHMHLTSMQRADDGSYLGAGVSASAVSSARGWVATSDAASSGAAILDMAGPMTTPGKGWWTGAGGEQFANAFSRFRSNYNAVELLTPVSADDVFNIFLRTFSGVNAGDVASVLIATPDRTVTNIGQTLSFTLDNPILAFLQPPFSVTTIRFDVDQHTISAKTDANHPLSGWRYWRVCELTPGDLVVETGAVDSPATGKNPLANYFGFLIDKTAKGDQLAIWKEDLEYILTTSGAQRGTSIPLNLIDGVWDSGTFNKRYIMQHVLGPAERVFGTATTCK